MNMKKLNELADLRMYHWHRKIDYKCGAWDYLEAVWHKPSEKPEVEWDVYTHIVFDRKMTTDAQWFRYDFEVVNYFTEHSDIIRWAYVNDLLPPTERKEGDKQ